MDTVTVQLSRAERDAVVAFLNEYGAGRAGDFEGPALDVLDLREALRKLEAAGRGPRLVA